MHSWYHQLNRMAACGKTCVLCVEVLCLFLVVLDLSHGDEPTSIITTTYGDVQGVTKYLSDGSRYDQFLGIPFGAAPIGEGRFTKPINPDSWNGTRQTVEYGSPCVQIIDPNGNEDCLYLNVVVPGGVDTDEDPLPVMVYSYGGAFVLGSANQYRAHGFAVRAKVVVVTYNYRVGPIGFMSTGDDWSPGNYGLWDAHATFKWVRDNIRAFGGDPTRVTAFGHSSGAAMSSHFVTSPMARGLVHRVLALSGTASAFFGTASKNTKIARNLGLASLCPIWSNKAMVKCLKKMGAQLLDVNGYVAAVVFGQQFPAWPPVVDGDFVPQLPLQALEQGAGADVDLLIGRTNDDAANLVYVNPIGLPNWNLNLAANPTILDLAIKAIVRPFGDANRLTQIIKDQYPELLSEDLLTRTKAASQVLTDWAFASPAHLEAGLHSKNAGPAGHKTFLYNFRYRQSFQHYESWVNGSHVDDTWSIFGEEFNAPFRQMVLGNFSDTDRLVSQNLARYYGNFAHTGDPNEGPHTVATRWPQYNTTTQHCMEQGKVMQVKTVSADMRRRYSFWTEVWPNITAPTEDTVLNINDIAEVQRGLGHVIQHIKDYVQYILG